MIRMLLVASLLLSGILESVAADRLVVRTDFDVSAGWTLKTFLGRDFWPQLIWYGWASPLAKDVPEGYDVYRECAIQAAGHPGPRKVPFEGPYTLSDHFKGGYDKLFAAISTTNFNHRPVVLSLRGARPVWTLKADYPESDRAGFAAWKAAHPNYLGHSALGEIDSDGFHYPKKFRAASPELRQQMQEAYPATAADVEENVYYRDRWIYEAAKRTSAYCFGDEGFWGEPSWYPGLTPLLVDAGAKGAGYEATGAQMAQSWSFGMAYARGAARLYGRPVWWYTANCYSGYTRDGRRKGGENRLTGNAAAKNAHGMKDEWWGPNNGLSPSLVARQNLYGYLSGAMILEVENHHHCHIEELPDGRKVPSVHARHFNDLHRLSKRLDRGIPYTPFALLLPAHERVTAEGNPEMNRYMGLSISAATLTLVPARNRRKAGIEGCLYNSEFGEIFDFVCPDLRRTDETVAALGAYKAAVLVGNFRTRSPEHALSGFVRGGGTLFVSCDQVRAGLVSPALAGVTFGGRSVKTAGKFLVDERGGRTALRDPYVLEAGEPTTAKALWTDEDGTPVAWANDCGKGRVVSVAVAGLVPYGLELPRNLENEREALRQVERLRSGELPCDLLRAIYRRIQAETMPVRVEGDVQWGVNRTKGGYLVWLFNNEGVTHFMGEEQSLDASKTAHVRLSFGDRAPKSVADAETGAPFAVAEGVSLDVPPGGWRLVAVEI